MRNMVTKADIGKMGGQGDSPRNVKSGKKQENSFSLRDSRKNEAQSAT